MVLKKSELTLPSKMQNTPFRQGKTFLTRGIVIIGCIRNVIWSSAFSIKSKLFAELLLVMISLLHRFLLSYTSLPFGFCLNNTTLLSFQIRSNQTKTDLSSTELSNPIQSNPPTPTGARMGTDRMGARECYREVILDNIEYSYLVQDSHIDREQLDEIVDLIVDTVCSARKVIRIAGDDYPAEVVKSRFMKLNSSHVQYVMDCMKDNTTYVRNIKKYLLAALYNAPTTINSYYSSLVQHDMYGDGQRGRG